VNGERTGVEVREKVPCDSQAEVTTIHIMKILKNLLALKNRGVKIIADADPLIEASFLEYGQHWSGKHFFTTAVQPLWRASQ